jgi:hypothetical protein
VKSFKYSGVWWLPSQEDHKVAGEATFVGEGQTKLVLQGAFAHEFKPGKIEYLPWYPIILGRTEAGQPITLFRCQETSVNISSIGQEIGEQECTVEIAFIGAHFTDPQQILFKKVDIHYSYLPQWAGLFPYRGYQKTFDDVRASITKGTITVQLIENIWNELTQKTELIKEADLPEIVRIRCEIQEALLLEEWVAQFVVPLQHLISLAIQRPNAIVNIVGYVKQNEESNQIMKLRRFLYELRFLLLLFQFPRANSLFRKLSCSHFKRLATSVPLLMCGFVCLMS